jgi:pyruvyl transferase EpsO
MHVLDAVEAETSTTDGLSHRAVIARLQQGIREVLAPLAPSGRFALVDFPAHSNVGDAAIWLGELRAMREIFGAAPAYVSKLDDFDAAACRAAIGDGPIFVHGGGNFGDLWPAHHEFRLRLLADFPERAIIQLPQSIHFRDPAGVAATARAITAHGNFTLLVRDQASLGIAQSFGCSAALCCDLALYLGAKARPTPPRADVICLLRTDGERALAEPPPPATPHRLVVDWLGESRSRVRGSRVLAILAAAAGGHLARHHLQAASFEAAAEARVRRGLRLLSEGRVLVTDRLHAHILAVLLGMPHAVLDNNYGKISSFIFAWTRLCPRMTTHTSLREALQWAEDEARFGSRSAGGTEPAGVTRA